MPSLTFVTYDVFSQERYQGNPLAIVRVGHGDTITTAQMQAIACEFNLSETVFVHDRQPEAADPNGAPDNPDSVPSWRIRIFVTNAELPFAGHPVIGTAHHALNVLAPGTKRGRFICNAGPIDLQVSESGAVTATVPHNVHLHQAGFPVEQVLALQPALPQEAVRTVDVLSPVQGMNFVYIGLQSLEHLALVQPSGMHAKPQLDRDWDHGFVGTYFYVVTRPGADAVQLRTRMIEGTLEDPATGSAACGLGALFAMKGKSRVMHLEITQGVEMGRKSEIGVSVGLKGGSEGVEKVELSGWAVKVMEGRLEY